MHHFRSGATVLVLLLLVSPGAAAGQEPRPELAQRLAAIAKLAQSAPMVTVPEGWFLMGTNLKRGEPFGLTTQFDDTEQPQRRIWLDAFAIDRDEVSLAEYLAFLQERHQSPPEELQRLIWHVITVHLLPDYILATWPALFVTWSEADALCRSRGKRLPTEAEWEKAARGTDGRLFPWGSKAPALGLAVFGQHHVHEIPIVAAVNSGEEGQSPFGARHMAGNIAEWVQDWFGNDSYVTMPERNPRGPAAGRYKSVRGGSWRSNPSLLRTATRNGAVPDQRSPTIGFRCAK
jgi:gamma-glutamyl hercynylcysteine S-oxide synthase